MAIMNIQIFGTKKCNDTKKAQRYFKERGIKFQFIGIIVILLYFFQGQPQALKSADRANLGHVVCRIIAISAFVVFECSNTYCIQHASFLFTFVRNRNLHQLYSTLYKRSIAFAKK